MNVEGQQGNVRALTENCDVFTERSGVGWEGNRDYQTSTERLKDGDCLSNKANRIGKITDFLVKGYATIFTACPYFNL